MRRYKNVHGKRNKKWFERFLTELNEEGFETYDVNFGDGYFIFSMGDNSVMHFKIKGLKRWLFGAWITYGKECPNNAPFVIQVFCQPILFLDKFKPSRGYFSVDVTPNMFIGGNIAHEPPYFTLYELIDYLNFMKKHEAVFFCCESDITRFDSVIKCKFRMFRDYIKHYYDNWHRKQLYNKMQFYIRLGGKLNLISTAYDRDRLNENKHINDYYHIYARNSIGNILAKHIKKLNDKDYDLGTVYIYNVICDWMAGYNNHYYTEDVHSFTEQQIQKEINEILQYERGDGFEYIQRVEFFGRRPK